MLSVIRCLARTCVAAPVSPTRGRLWLAVCLLAVGLGARPAAAQRYSGAAGDPPPGDLLRMTPLAEIRLDPRPLEYEAPPDASRGLMSERLGDLRELRMVQGWAPVTMQWRASEFWHRPLYFEDVLLERHGQTRGPLLQPFYSAMHFYGSVVTLPYKMGLDYPWDRLYTLGYGRPGSCKPPLRRRLPLEADASLYQAAAIVGVVALLVP